MSESLVKVRIRCPARRGQPGFWSAQTFFEVGEYDRDLSCDLVEALEREIAAGVSILTVTLIDAPTVEVPFIPPDAGPVTMEAPLQQMPSTEPVPVKGKGKAK